MFPSSQVADFFAKLIQRVAPKSYQQAFGEVYVTEESSDFCMFNRYVSWQGPSEFLGIILGSKVMVSAGLMDL